MVQHARDFIAARLAACPAVHECDGCRKAREKSEKTTHTPANKALLQALKGLYNNHNIIALRNRLAIWPVRLPLDFEDLHRVVDCGDGTQMHAFAAATHLILLFLNQAAGSAGVWALQDVIQRQLTVLGLTQRFPTTLCCSWLRKKLESVLVLPGSDARSGLQFTTTADSVPAEMFLEEIFQKCGVTTMDGIYTAVPGCLMRKLPATLGAALKLVRCRSKEHVDDLPAFAVVAYQHAAVCSDLAFSSKKNAAAMAQFEECCAFLAAFGFAYCKIDVLPPPDSLTLPGNRKRRDSMSGSLFSDHAFDDDGVMLERDLFLF